MGGNFTLQNNENMSKAEFPALQDVGGAFSIQGNASLATATFTALSGVIGDLTISGTDLTCEEVEAIACDMNPAPAQTLLGDGCECSG